MLHDRALAPLARMNDLAFLLLRAMTGIFLIYGVWDNIIDPARMREFVGFVRANGFPAPAIAAPLSVGIQFLCGLGFLVGFLTRTAALLCIANFVIALVMVHWNQDLRSWWPALALIGIGGVFATHGPGRYALEAWLASRVSK